MKRRVVLKLTAALPLAAVLASSLAACGAPKPQNEAAKAVEGFLNAGYGGRTAKDFNLIRNASGAEAKRIFSSKFPDVAKFVDVESAYSEQIIKKMSYFSTMYKLTDGVPVHVKVDPIEIQAKVTGPVSFANVPERAITLYIDDEADIPSSTPDNLAYTVIKDDKSGRWLISLSDPTGKKD